MADDSGAKKVNPTLEKHWEKIILGIVAVLGIVFIGSQVSGGGNKAVKGLESASGGFKRTRENHTPGVDSPKNDPAPSVSAVQGPESPGPFTVGNKTKFIPEIKKAPPAPTAIFWLPKLTMASPVPTFEGVKLSWTLSGEPPEKTDKAGPYVVPPASFFFTIERQKKGDKDWSILAKEIKGDKFEYIDEKTVPKTEYSYRVTLGSTDTKFTARFPGRLSDHVSGPGSVRTLGIWSFEFSNHLPGDPDADEPVPAEVWVRITKFDPEFGKVEWTRRHKLAKGDKDGTPLGFGDEDGKVTSVHSVTAGKGRPRKVLVDFNSGARILKISVDKPVPYKYKACDPKVAEGVDDLVCDGPKELDGTYRVNEVVFLDEEGKEQTDRKISGSGPLGDRLCKDHGGAPPPPPPVVDATDDKKKGGREEEAAKLLDDADTLWMSAKSADKKLAVEKYKKLIATYADTMAVKESKERITDRSKKKFD